MDKKYINFYKKFILQTKTLNDYQVSTPSSVERSTLTWPYALSVMRCRLIYLSVKITSGVRERVFSTGGKAFSSLLMLAIIYSLGRFDSETGRSALNCRLPNSALDLLHCGLRSFTQGLVGFLNDGQ
jgi:hypothetical protein